MEVKHEVNFGSGFVVVPEPKNFPSVEVDIIFNKDKARASFANVSMVWQGSTAKKFYDVYWAGRNGGKGVSEALPYKVTICGPNLTFNLMVMMGHTTSLFSCDHVEIPVWQAQGADWFEQNTDGYTFWHLFDKGIISYSDYKEVPYLITEIPNYTQVISCSISLFLYAWQLRQLIMEISEKSTEIVADTGESAVPVVGTPHILVTVAHVANLILRIAYIVLMVVLMFQLAKDLVDNIIQRKKYKLAMREEDVWKKIAQFLGLNFSSPIYAPTSIFHHATCMPQKIVMEKVGQNVLDTFNDALFSRPENEKNNALSYGYPDGTMLQWITSRELKYNAEAKVINGTLYFKEVHDWNVPNPYKLPNTKSDGYTFNLPAPFRHNLGELNPFYEVKFTLDETELNTIHRYRGTTASVQIITQYPITKYSGWGQGKIVEWGEALAKRKDYTTKVENVLSAVLQVLYDLVTPLVFVVNSVVNAINAVIGVINAIINIFGGNTIGYLNSIQNPVPLNAISQRIGWMQLSNDSFNVPKTFIGVQVGSDWELDPSTEQNMSAISLMNEFHGKNLATRGNQYLLYENNQTKFCCKDFAQIVTSNILVTPDNKPGKFDSMKWNLKMESARDVHYRIKETYLTGLSEKIKIDGTT